MVTLFKEIAPPDLDVDESASEHLSRRINAGVLGGGGAVSLANMQTTEDMVGRSVVASCTHKSPMWMHLETSMAENG